ncbi:MAG: Crp/Fnr family transcriptional regulator [Arenicellales bacterium]|nr:Crp/Fnr family transcriptional regulator [Arenicellales bacterium]
MPQQTPLNETLRKCALLSSLDELQLERIAEKALWLKLGEGETLFEQGDPAKRFYISASGRLKLFNLSQSGDEKVVRIITPGETFGEALIFLNRASYPISAQALKPAEVVALESADFAAILRESIDTCFAMMGAMSQRLHRMLGELSDLSLHTGTCRVAAHFAQAANGEGHLELQVPKQVVASHLSIKPETFSRILKNLSNNGIISVQGSHVTIADPPALLELASVCNTGTPVAMIDTASAH